MTFLAYYMDFCVSDLCVSDVGRCVCLTGCLASMMCCGGWGVCDVRLEPGVPVTTTSRLENTGTQSQLRNTNMHAHHTPPSYLFQGPACQVPSPIPKSHAIRDPSTACEHPGPV